MASDVAAALVGSLPRARRPAPAVALIFRLEERPMLHFDFASDLDAARLTLWLEAHPDWLDLLEAARALADGDEG